MVRIFIRLRIRPWVYPLMNMVIMLRRDVTKLASPKVNRRITPMSMPKLSSLEIGRFQGLNPGDSSNLTGQENFGIAYPEKFQRNFRDLILRNRYAIYKGESGSIKIPRACPWGSIFSILFVLTFSMLFQTEADDVVPKGETAPKYEKGNKRDPFIPIVTSDGQLINIEDDDKAVKLNLEGIIFDKEGNSMAIINGQILKKNDTILDVQIVEVRKDGIVYVKDGEIFVLNLKGEE